MSHIHYFNPGHETAILLGTSNYTPPANVRNMQKELATLPAWYAEAEDLVYVPELNAPCLQSSGLDESRQFPRLVTPSILKERAAGLPDLQAMPWGLSPQSIKLFTDLREKTGIFLSVPEWKETYALLTGRQTAAKCLAAIQTLLPDLPIPVAPRFCTNVQEIEQYMLSHTTPFVLKTPYSSSGRGLLWAMKRELGTSDKNWINGALQKQGTISIEQGLENAQDFALEFYSDGEGTVRYEGLSVFSTEERGAYSGNVLEDQSTMRARITRFTGEEIFERIRAAVTQVLQEVYGSIYTGYLGVDMLVFRQADGTFAIHPAVEINMRYTMGMVALNLYRKWITPGSQGHFYVTFDKEKGEAYGKHRSLQTSQPLQTENSRIKAGYLSLCPVTEETHYRAWLLISDAGKQEISISGKV